MLVVGMFMYVWLLCVFLVGCVCVGGLNDRSVVDC